MRAEQALLGSVLSDPGGQAYLLDLVRPEDFWRPYHGQVLSAMQRAQAGAGLPGPQAVYQEIGQDPDLPREISGNAALLADLMQSAPRPGHAPAYAAMVIGGGIRRRITLAASRMHQAAADEDLAVAMAMTARARREIRNSQSRWLALPTAVRREPLDHLRAQPGFGDLITSAAQAADEIRQLRRELPSGGEVEPQRRLASIAERIASLAETSADLRGAVGERQQDGAGQRASEAEGLAIRHLVAAPAQLAAIGGWLQPGHFTDTQHRAIYRVVRDLAAEGHPVDPVTVAWEAARREIPVSIADLSDGTAPFATAAAREVARHGILMQISQAARDLRASAASHRQSTAGLLRDSGQRLQDLQRDWPQHSAGHIRPAHVRTLHPPVPGRHPRSPAEQEKEATA